MAWGKCPCFSYGFIVGVGVKRGEIIKSDFQLYVCHALLRQAQYKLSASA